jgi:hypothetical protein
MPMLMYLDETFGLFNQTLDPQLGDSILELNPWLRSALGSEIGGKPKVEAKTDDFGTESAPPEFIEPNILMKLVWQSLLKEVCVHLLELVKSSESEEVRAQIESVGSIVEMLKALFYCEGGGVRAGFSVKELEGERYREFRETVRIVKGVRAA